MTKLTPKRRSELRSEAHKLNPLVIIGDKGLTDEVLAEIDRTLKAHELIKVRAGTDDRAARDRWFTEICDRLQALPVQQIGKVFVLFRENPARHEAESGARRAGRAGAGREEGGRRGRAEVVSERGKLRQRSRDLDKQREADVKDMVRKGKIKLETESRSTARGSDVPPAEGSTRTSRPRSRTPAPRPESGPRRRPRSTSR